MQPETPEQEAYYARTRRPLFQRPTTWYGKLLLGFALVVWFGLLLLPCACFFLATSGQITIAHGNVPDAEIHPLLQIDLIMQPKQRGLQFTRSVILPRDATDVCVETYVSYALWQTDGSNANVVYCDCYAHAAENAAWTLTSAVYEACREELP